MSVNFLDEKGRMVMCSPESMHYEDSKGNYECPPCERKQQLQKSVSLTVVELAVITDVLDAAIRRVPLTDLWKEYGEGEDDLTEDDFWNAVCEGTDAIHGALLELAKEIKENSNEA